MNIHCKIHIIYLSIKSIVNKSKTNLTSPRSPRPVITIYTHSPFQFDPRTTRTTLTNDLEMRNTRDLARLVAGSALVGALVFGEGARNMQRVHAVLGVHLEVLGGLDDLVVVVPLHHGFCMKIFIQNKT